MLKGIIYSRNMPLKLRKTRVPLCIYLLKCNVSVYLEQPISTVPLILENILRHVSLSVPHQPHLERKV